MLSNPVIGSLKPFQTPWSSDKACPFFITKVSYISKTMSTMPDYGVYRIESMGIVKCRERTLIGFEKEKKFHGLKI
jgi:hypothetical protein